MVIPMEGDPCVTSVMIGSLRRMDERRTQETTSRDSADSFSFYKRSHRIDRFIREEIPHA
jgi:hypothetical protein